MNEATSSPVGSAVRLGGWVGVILAGAVLLVGLFVDTDRTFAALLVAGAFGLTVGLGVPLLAAVCTLCGARWWEPLRPLVHTCGRTLVLPGSVIFATLAGGLWFLYPWADAEVVAHSHLLQMKEAWLNPFFFLARAIVVLLLWFGMTGLLLRSLGSNRSGEAPTPRRGAALFLVVFVPTLSVATWDWFLSLEPEWFSTMSSALQFASLFLGAIAAVTLLSQTPLGRRLGCRFERDEQRHDLGKMLFAFSMFWAYVWFCQLMLIWYANIPEETSHYAQRWQGGWTLVFWLNPILSFGVPFAVLLPSGPKRHATTLVQVSLAVLVGRWLELYLWVEPTLGPAPAFPVLAVVATLGLLAGMVLVVARALSSPSIA
ncbi:MAG: hypothetical protein RL885_28850 [Planctomycetota bacterium]